MTQHLKKQAAAEDREQGSAAARTFSLLAFRFTFRAEDAVRFPPGQAGNTLRGAFGTIFRRLVCVPECPGPRECERRSVCPYARIFEPAVSRPAPSGLADPPRPFVFRAAHLDGSGITPGECFHFDLHLFDCREPALEHFAAAFSELAREGLGPGRGRAELVSVDRLDARREPVEPVLDRGAWLRKEGWPPIELSLAPDRRAVSRIVVRFLTPAELKAGRRIVTRPEFAVLFARARDRVSALRTLYGPGPLAVDFKALGERAAAVRLTHCELRWEKTVRRSTRTGQRHPLGGFTGEAAYEGDLAEFLPWLRAAEWTGVGRHTVWGKGAIEVEAVPE